MGCTGDRCPAACPSLLLSYRLLYCAVQYGRTQSYGYGSKSLWIRLKVPPQRTGDVRRSAARRRCLDVVGKSLWFIIRTLRATTLLIHMCITTKALFWGGENISALFYAPAAPYQPRRLQIDVALRGSLQHEYSVLKKCCRRNFDTVKFWTW